MEIKLKDVFEFKNGLANKKTDNFKKNLNSKFITFISVFKSNINYSDFGSVYVNENEKQNIVKKNDLLINMTSESLGEIGWINLYELNHKPYLNSFSKILRIKNIELFNPHYLKYLLLSPKMRKKIINEGQGITRVNLSIERFGNITIPLIDINKQKIIGEFLSNIDKKIELIKKEIEINMKYKTIILNSVFNYKIKNIEIKLKDIIIENKEKNKNGINYPVESISNKFGFLIQEEYFGKKVASINKSNYYVTRENLIAFNPSRINVGSIAIKKSKQIGLISPLYVNFYLKDNIDKNYFINFFKTFYFEKQRIENTIISVRESLTLDSFKNIKIPLIGINKQRKIGNFLSNIDIKMEKLKNNLVIMNEYKNIILNKIF